MKRLFAVLIALITSVGVPANIAAVTRNKNQRFILKNENNLLLANYPIIII